MSTINRLSSVDALQPGDLIPVWDGSNGDTRKASLTTLLAFIESNFADPDYSTRIVAPNVDGFNVDIGNTGDSSWLIVNPTLNYTTGSITLPSTAYAVNDQEITVVFTAQVASFSITGAGATVLGAPTQIGTYDSFRVRYNAAQLTWYTLDTTGDGSGAGTSSIVRQDFTGDGVVTTFALANAPAALGNELQVFIDGVYQERAGYSVSGNDLVFSEAPPVLSTIEVLAWGVNDIGATTANLVTYTPAGTGAVVTTVQDKLRESISILDFGADPTGTTDSQPAIQAAIDAAPAGGTITLPVGVYRVSATININKIALQFRGTGSVYSGVDILVDHTAGPGIRVSTTSCVLSDFKVTASVSRAAGGAGTGLTGNYGILYEGSATNASYITRQVCQRVQVDSQPSHGFVSSGHVWYSTFTQINATNNGGHGFIVDAGETTGRANLDYNGLSTITYLVAVGNGGHGLAIGTPAQLTVDQALRMKIDNYDGGNNATDAGIRFSAHDSYIIGTNHVVEQSAWDGALGAVQLMGDNIGCHNNRLVGGLTAGITVTVPPGGGTSDGIVIDRLRANTTGPLNPAIDIASANARYTTITQRSTANITKLVRDLGQGTRIDYIGALGYTQVATYDFAVDGGAIGNIPINARIPTGATITHAFYEVITAPTSAGAATLAFGVDVNDLAGLKAATPIASYTTGYGDLLPDNTAANFTTKTSNPRNIIMTVATAALTAGKINVYFTYSVSP